MIDWHKDCVVFLVEIALAAVVSAIFSYLIFM